jgi:hypothetical protein
MSEKYTSPFLGRVAKRVPGVAERLWELRRDGHWARAGLIYHSNPDGFEFQLFIDKHFIEGRRFGHRERAIEYGDKVRADYERDGWA